MGPLCVHTSYIPPKTLKGKLLTTFVVLSVLLRLMVVCNSALNKVVPEPFNPSDSFKSRMIKLSQNACFFGLTNVCLHNRTLRPYCSQVEEYEFVSLSDSRVVIDWKPSSFERRKSLKWFKGQSMILDDFDNGFLLHLFHFIEHAIGHFILKKKYEIEQDRPLHLSQVYMNLVSSLWNGPRKEWNELIMIRGLDGFHRLHFSEEDFLDTEACFEYLTISSRRACEENSVNSEINKSLGDTWFRITSSLLRDFAKRMQALPLEFNQRSLRKQKIVSYIKRKPPRTLEPVLERSMIDLIQSMRGFELRILQMEDMDPQAQLEAIKDTDILIGVHGNGLSHIAFLVKDSYVIEIFPPDFSAFDYYLLSEMFGHRYFRFRDDKNGSMVFNGALYEGLHGEPNSPVTNLNLEQLENLLKSLL
ncbi:hypothetical protein GAYE_HTGSCF06PCTG21G0292 [Galdieria yellowstonensis]|uniref:Glycosyltransferase 61 catalytic domain-containing protein n=1 Tax=Galdieria yellowstonensis TaxID=3028027 RepID=A0AAV9I2I5_9RHOD|nr:hypothetical protein GAYE_HTGSCF06PCTG21G0292 [Galdieria yellowstonensis]